MAQNFLSSGSPGKAGGGLPPSARSIGVRPCPNCGTEVNVSATVCTACGERLPSQNRTIRCRRCRQRANASLVICPHCGRDLQPARSRWLTWGAPLAIVLLLGLLLMVRGARSNPIAWAQARVNGLNEFMGSISEQLDPEVNIVFVPPDTNLDNPLASQAALTAPQPTSESLPSSVAELAPVATAEEQPAVAAVPALPAGDGAATPLAEAVAAPEITTPTVAPPATASATVTIAPPEDAALALATPTPLGNLYRVQRGDTVFDIAIRYGLSEEELLAANGLSQLDAFTLQPGQDLIIPADATATPAETPTAIPSETPTATSATTPTETPGPAVNLAVTSAPSATPAPVTNTGAQSYTIRAGDTLAAIALRNGATIDSILTINNLTLAEGRRLVPGQLLLIPLRPAQNSLSLPTATPTAPSTLRLAAPELRAPADGATLSCQSNATLVWQPVPGIRMNDFYVVHLGYVGTDDTVVWVAQPQRAANVVAWDIDAALCDLPPAGTNGEWRWWAEVVTGGGTAQEPVSPPSETRSFVWQ